MERDNENLFVEFVVMENCEYKHDKQTESFFSDKSCSKNLN